MIRHFELNEKGRDFVVGDIHGCFGKLEEKLLDINFSDSCDRLFSVGDLIDRGPKSEDCVKWINKHWFNAVRGNHEQMAIDYVNCNLDSSNYFRNGGSWLMGMQTIDQICYAEMLGELPIVIDVQTKNGLVGIVHACCPVDCWSKLECRLIGDNADLFQSACLWDRSIYDSGYERIISGVNKIFCGHTIQKEPTIIGNIHYINTGAFLGNDLTVIEL